MSLPSRIAGAPEHYDIAILGGGLIGMSLACQLYQDGGDDPPSIVIIEKNKPKRGGGWDDQVVFLSPDAIDFFKSLDLWQQLARYAAPVLAIHLAWSLYPGNRPQRMTSLDVEDQSDHDKLGVIIASHYLHNALARCCAATLPSSTWIAPAQLESTSVHDECVLLTLADGRQISTDLWVVAAGSATDKTALADLRAFKHDYHQSAITAWITHQNPHHDCAAQYFFTDGPMALLPLKPTKAGARSALIWTQAAPRAKALTALDEPSFKAVLQERCGDFVGTIDHISKPVTRPLRLILPHQLISPRRVLIGDSAHHIHPLAGQGFNIGLRDVRALAAALDAARNLGLDCGHPSALTDYQQRRRSDGIAFGLGSDLLNQLFATRSLPLRLSIGLAMGAIDQSDFLRRQIINLASGGLENRLRSLLP